MSNHPVFEPGPIVLLDETDHRDLAPHRITRRQERLTVASMLVVAAGLLGMVVVLSVFVAKLMQVIFAR